MSNITFNGFPVTVDVHPSTPLLWVLRDHLGLTGAKFGVARHCAARGEALRSCAHTIDGIAGKRVVTIEGLSKEGLSKLQQAWIAHQVPQCGYCQPGFIMAATALLAKIPKPTQADIEGSITNIC